MSSRLDEVRDYAFADRALALRKRAGLTQRDLAALLGVSFQAISAWENGLSYPAAERLEELIACYLTRGAFESGREAEEAATLWETGRANAAQRLAPFDPAWFASLARAHSAPAPARGPTNIPAARTTFVGRVADLAALARELDPKGDGTRLLTLIGVAGCGKTRLALAAVNALRDSYSDGCWLVELAMLPASEATDPGPMASAVLAALGLHELPGQTLLDTATLHLRARRLLLVLDNCEHVAAACATLTAWLLRACPELRILATSQRTLGTADEIVQPVATFAAPTALEGVATPAVLESVGQFDAVRLFVDRARAVRPGFALDAENAAMVVAICHRLDGLPLAIELAAARLGMLPIEEVLARLDDRFRLLRRGGRHPADRHRALQATLDWSYGLLDFAGQALLRRLAVFADGWDVGAAEQVCADVADDVLPPEAVLELLDELLDRSLVYVHEAGGPPRYGLLETVRQYSAQQLERAGEAAQVHGRHLAWCATLAGQAATALLGPDQVAWLARLDREHDNLRAAMRWTLDHHLGEPGLRVAAGLWQFWRNRGYLSEGRRWLRELLALAAESHTPPNLTLRVVALEGAAWLAHDQHDFTDAASLFAESSALHRVAGLDERPIGALINRAMDARAIGDYARAAALLEEALAQQRAAGSRDTIMRGGLGLSLSRLALVLREQGAYARATALYEECRALHRELGDREGVASALLGLCDIARDQGDVVHAREYGETCLAVFREYGLQWAIGFSLNNLALAAYQDGDLAQAALCVEESVALFRGLRAGPCLAEVLITLGRIRATQGDSAAARAQLAEALTVAWEEGPRVFAAAALEELALLAGRQDQAWQAVYLLSTATKLRQIMGAPPRPIDRPAMEGALQAAHSALGDAAYAAAWSIGQRQPVEQIVARVSPIGTAVVRQHHDT